MLFLASSLVLAVIAPLVASGPHPKVKVDVYYESLCPDSIKFFNVQLNPTYLLMASHMDITLVPFGRATQGHNSAGELEFTCKHGPDECYGNKVHSCAIHKLGKEDNQLMKLLNCLMVTAKVNTTYPTEACAELTHVKVDEIVTCANGTEGSHLLSEMGNMTAALVPKLKSVPTIVINGKFSDDNQLRATTKLSKLICSLLHDDKPEACATNSATVYTISISALLLLGVRSIL